MTSTRSARPGAKDTIRHWYYVGVVIALFGVWIAVATQTAIAVWTGKVLESPHQPTA